MSLSKVFRDDGVFKPVTLLSKEEIIQQENKAEQNVPTLKETDRLKPENSESEEAAVAEEGEPVADQVEVQTSDNSTPTSETKTETAPPDIEALCKQSYEEGVQHAVMEETRKLHTLATAFETACNELSAMRSTLLHGSRETMINLIMELCQKIIKEELSTPRDRISRNLEEALKIAINSEEYAIKLHPDDLKTVEELKPALMESIQGLEHIVILPDSSITRGGCTLESNKCLVDATIEGQLKEAHQFLNEQLDDPEPIDSPESQD